MELSEAAEAYKATFGDVPTIIGIPSDKLDLAAKLLADAVVSGKKFASDRDFDAALGLDPLPDNAEI